MTANGRWIALRLYAPRRYLGLDILTRSRAALTATNPEETTHLAIASALSA